MLQALRAKHTDRKLRLFACACIRRVFYLLKAEPSRQALEVSELFVDALATINELQAAHGAASAPLTPSWWRGKMTLGLVAESSGWEIGAARIALVAVRSRLSIDDLIEVNSEISRAVQTHPFPWESWFDWGKASRCHANLIRDIFGYPFQAVDCNQAWLTNTVRGLAESIYDDRAFDRLPILGDALLDAGCDDAEVTDHCRSAGPHVRGCWVVDLLLDKH